MSGMISMRTNEGRPARSAKTFQPERRPDLQGMRAVAVLTVFANHLFDWPPGGFVGVDVFFVLSGFFITGILLREVTATGNLSFQNFYIRRVKRILPSALLVLTVTVIAAYILFPATRAKATLLDALYAAVFASNFRFEAVAADYFQRDLPQSPLQHYWSLSIEEQFYFVWPALLLFIFALTRQLLRNFRNRSRDRGRKATRLGLVVAMSAVVLLSFGWALFLSANSPSAAYFSTFTRVWELGVGALLAITAPWMQRIPSAVRPGLAYLGLAGVLASLFLITSTVLFPAPWAALPVLSTALVVASFQGRAVSGMVVLTNPIAGYFGDTSYTLYLWHWPVIVLLETLIPKGPVFYGLAVALSLSLTAVTYRFYENPIRRSHWLIDRPTAPGRRFSTPSPSAQGLIGGFAAALIVLTILSIGYSDKLAVARKEAAIATNKQSQGPTGSEPAPKVDPCFGAPAMLNSSCKLRDSAVPLQPPVDGAHDDVESKECYVQETENLRSCHFGYKGPGAKRIALVGDSHASAILPAITPVLEANKWSLTTYTGYHCSLTNEPAQCAEDTKAELLANPYDLVVFTSFNKGGHDPAEYQEAWRPIAAAGNRLAGIVDNPRQSKDALACLSRDDDESGECGTPRAAAFGYLEHIESLAQSIPGTTVIDLSAYYCKDDFCPSVIGNVIVYRDQHHLTATFARTLAQPVEDGLRRALEAPKPG